MKHTFVSFLKSSIPVKLHITNPINLVTSFYKIIAKVLSLRLKEVLEDTISCEHGAFIAGRQILDVALIANEVVDEYRSSGKRDLVLKIDFEKGL